MQSNLELTQAAIVLTGREAETSTYVIAYVGRVTTTQATFPDDNWPVLTYYPWDNAPELKPPEVNWDWVYAERALWNRLGIESCKYFHDRFKGTPTDSRISRWQFRSARGFRFRQIIHRYGEPK